MTLLIFVFLGVNLFRICDLSASHIYIYTRISGGWGWGVVGENMVLP